MTSPVSKLIEAMIEGSKKFIDLYWLNDGGAETYEKKFANIETKEGGLFEINPGGRRLILYA